MGGGVCTRVFHAYLFVSVRGWVERGDWGFECLKGWSFGCLGIWGFGGLGVWGFFGGIRVRRLDGIFGEALENLKNLRNYF